MNLKHMGIVVALSLILLADAHATKLPAYYPQSFRFIGTLDRLDHSRSLIVIGDLQLVLPGNVKVHTLHTEFGTVNSLRPGMKVGATLGQSRSGRPMVSEIWVLPDDYRQHFPGR